MRHYALGGLFAAIVSISAGAATANTNVFDTPIETKTIILPATETQPKPKLTCRYYPHFMVKEVDEGEVGAALLSIVTGDIKPTCQRALLANEKAVDPKDWSGYVLGAKGRFVFFSADDGVNGGLGFAVYSLGGKKLFEDSAMGDIHSAAATGDQLTLRYLRSYAGPCSVQKDGAACWTQIAAAIHIDAAAKPDCVAGYAKAKSELAKGRCEADKKAGDAPCIAAALKEIEAQHWDEAPSVVDYEVETVLTGSSTATTPVGAATLCHPSD
jgi:hypothetical protein